MTSTTANQATVVANSTQSLAQADSQAFDGLGIDSTPAATGWRESEGSPLAEGESARAHALHTDTHHPASRHYQFSTPASVERQAERRWSEGVAFTYRAFTTPPQVTLNRVEHRASRIDSPPSLSPYGGLRLVTAVAVSLVWDVSDRELWEDDRFRDEFRTEVGQPSQVSSSKALRKFFEIRQEVRE